jgi:hypothetical protein
LADLIKYYAIIDDFATRAQPAGLARRRHLDDGGIRDEALGRDLTWHLSPLIVEWKRAESGDDLVEISEDEAERIIAGFRERWGTPG